MVRLNRSDFHHWMCPDPIAKLPHHCPSNYQEKNRKNTFLLRAELIGQRQLSLTLGLGLPLKRRYEIDFKRAHYEEESDSFCLLPLLRLLSRGGDDNNDVHELLRDLGHHCRIRSWIFLFQWQQQEKRRGVLPLFGTQMIRLTKIQKLMFLGINKIKVMDRFDIETSFKRIDSKFAEALTE